MIKATFGSMREYHQFIAELGIDPDIKIVFDLLSFVKKTII